MSRRGRYSYIFSDCGNNFVGAVNHLTQFMQDATSDCSNIICKQTNVAFSVKAIVHVNRESHGMVVSGNFLLLKRYAMIHVIEADVPVLCQNTITDFPNLEVLNLIDINLWNIQTNAFQDVANLKQLSLAANNLNEIRKGSFNNLPSLEKLYLSANEISYIEDESFANLPQLKAIHLDRNKLTELKGDWFSKCPIIDTINLQFNVIETISSTALRGIKPNHVAPITISLNKNLIKEVDKLYMDTNNPIYLHLEGNYIILNDNSKLYLNKNKISCVSDDILENMQNTTKDLYLEGNPITCNCLKMIKEKIG
ncbi:hypothetical protein NQ317_008600 [Molorchus minor]|uniref:Uncharacterized protein n=1 Tax=Molorchus minor TaxID=1323400 RepID=A0ABQ9JB22_9CUCU|nr:hypothetical protein NQ317_008600 [Molorchus minor]